MTLDDKKKPQNRPCSLLTADENEKLFSSLGYRCFTLSSAVVQVFLTEGPSHSQWVKKFCGVVCFVKDYSRKSYFIRIFDMDKCYCVWEQELYYQMVYKTPCPFFHTFEADDCMTGLNFADNKEAVDFATAVQKKLHSRQEKKQDKKKNQQPVQPTDMGVTVCRSKSESMPSLFSTKEEKPIKEKQKKKKLTKEDISEPTNFIHMHHVGWDPEKGFAVKNKDDELSNFFALAGVTEKDLKDHDTRKFIYDFIDDHGGVERAKQEFIQARNVLPPPTREAPPTPRNQRGSPYMRGTAPPPPPPPSVPPVATRPPGVIPPPPPTRVPLPPKFPSSSATFMPPPPPPPIPNNSFSAQKETVVHPAPPPPPPPPPPSLNAGFLPPPPPPPPPPPISSATDGSGDARSALLEEIRKGKSLNPVESNGSNQDNARGALLNQIRQGVELKPVSDEPKPVPLSTPMQGLAGALARALQERNRAIHQTDESDSGEDDDEDEWED